MNRSEPPIFVPKYRRQSLHLSLRCGADHMIPWNKSFDTASCVHRAARSGSVEFARERLPSRANPIGNMEAVSAPYQRSGADPEHGDILFLWWQ
jgi:hypothetical protein